MAAKRPKRSAKRESPFGAVSRRRALESYLQGAGPVTAENAWEHVYRLLLSIDRRTQLAHVYDSSHMQPGHTFHGFATRFTALLCKHWEITTHELADRLDYMFKECVAEYIASRPPRPGPPGTIEELTPFARDVAERVMAKLGVPPTPALAAVAHEIEQEGEDHFTLSRKRQNVRGEGQEDILEWLLLNVASVPRGQLLVRSSAGTLPGFRPSTRGRRDKAPKPDLVLLAGTLTQVLWLITAKWSLRQDRLDQFGQEAAYYKDKRTQPQDPDFVLVTNEMDLARLRGVLGQEPAGGGFYFHRVYHINPKLLAEAHGSRFTAELEIFVREGRLRSLADFLADVAVEVGAAH